LVITVRNGKGRPKVRREGGDQWRTEGRRIEGEKKKKKKRKAHIWEEIGIVPTAAREKKAFQKIGREEQPEGGGDGVYLRE